MILGYYPRLLLEMSSELFFTQILSSGMQGATQQLYNKTVSLLYYYTISCQKNDSSGILNAFSFRT